MSTTYRSPARIDATFLAGAEDMDSAQNVMDVVHERRDEYMFTLLEVSKGAAPSWRCPNRSLSNA
jgi:hypothetical protein